MNDLIHACRRLVRRPVSAVGIVVTLTLGIGISVGMFSVLHGVVLQSLPYPDGNDIVIVHSTNPETGVPRDQLTPAEAIEGMTEVRGFDHVAYYHWGALTHQEDGAPRNITSLHVSENYFPVFGVQAALGRTLTAADVAEQRPVMVLSHAAWTSLTGGDPDAVGRSISFQGQQLELVGVLPESFAHPGTGQVIYTPIDAAALAQNVPVYRNARYIYAVGRLARGADTTFALDGLASRLAAVNESHSLPDRGWQLTFLRMIDDTIGHVRTTLFALFGVALLVLLIACANTASLVSIRLEQRNAELAVRRALGASGARVVTDVGLELGVLALVAGTGGVLIAYTMIGVVQPLAAGSLPRAADITVDTVALVFAAVVTLVSVLLSGALPLLRALRVGPAEGLRGGTSREVQGGGRIAWLPVAGVGLSTLALVAGLALVTSLVRLGNVDPGFRTDDIAALQLWRSEPAEVPRFIERATEAIEAVPGVREVAVVSAAPLSVVGSMNVDVMVRGRELVEPIQAIARRASPDYHRFMGTPLRGGRDISDQDVSGSPTVVVVNETLARRVFGDADPVGEVLMLPLGGGDRVPAEVIGVVADTANAGLRAPAQPELVVPVAQLPFVGITLLVDSAIMPPNWLQTLREAIWAIEPEQAIYRSFTLAGELETQMRSAKFFATATGWFAVFALLLGAAGINAVVAAMQRRRTREIGVRMALGAQPAHAARLMLGNAFKIVGLGLAAGGLVAYPAMGWLQGELFGLGAGAFWRLFAVTVAVLLTAGFAAAGWPAWRAARTAPMQALRYE